MTKRKKEENKCPNKAIYACPWAGKIMKSCKVHANSMAVLARVMGVPMQIEAITPNEQCMHPNDLEDYKPKQENERGKKN